MKWPVGLTSVLLLVGSASAQIPIYSYEESRELAQTGQLKAPFHIQGAGGATAWWHDPVNFRFKESQAFSRAWILIRSIDAQVSVYGWLACNGKTIEPGWEYFCINNSSPDAHYSYRSTSDSFIVLSHPAVRPVYSSFNESEPNNSPDTARPISHGELVSGETACKTRSDPDYFKIEVQRPSTMMIWRSGGGRVSVYPEYNTSSGWELAAIPDVDDRFSRTSAPSMISVYSGTYFVEVDNSGGTYLDCLDNDYWLLVYLSSEIIAEAELQTETSAHISFSIDANKLYSGEPKFGSTHWQSDSDLWSIPIRSESGTFNLNLSGRREYEAKRTDGVATWLYSPSIEIKDPDGNLIFSSNFESYERLPVDTSVSINYERSGTYTVRVFNESPIDRWWSQRPYGIAVTVEPEEKDADGDGVPDDEDNCPAISNPSQADTDNDGIGDACETSVIADADGDGVPDDEDNCPNIWNPFQIDFDDDGLGDVCDTDIDSDGVPNDEDVCPYGFCEPRGIQITRHDSDVDAISLWVSVEVSGRESYLGLVAQCATEKGVVGYQTRRGDDLAWPMRFTVSPLAEATPYRCWVNATNSVGTGRSDKIDITTLDAQSGLPIWLLYQATQ